MLEACRDGPVSKAALRLTKRNVLGAANLLVDAQHPLCLFSGCAWKGMQADASGARAMEWDELPVQLATSERARKRAEGASKCLPVACVRRRTGGGAKAKNIDLDAFDHAVGPHTAVDLAWGQRGRVFLDLKLAVVVVEDVCDGALKERWNARYWVRLSARRRVRRFLMPKRVAWCGVAADVWPAPGQGPAGLRAGQSG